MANGKMEGTFYLDGLFEGPLFSADDQEIINAFIKQAKKAGLQFHAAVSAGRFSLLADTEPVKIHPGGESADVRVVKCLNELLHNYSPDECMQLMSTLRSVEYVPGHEVQTIYGIKPDGTTAVEQRRIKADTISPMKPIDLRQKLKLIAVCVVVLCAGIGVSAFFVPYRDFARQLISKVMPFEEQDLKIDIGPFEQFFQIELIELDKDGGIIRIACRISDSYPTTEEKLNELWKSSSESMSQRLAVEALARNCVRCEFFDSDGNFRGQMICYMQWLEDDKKTFSIFIPFDTNLRQVRISY